jgi:hypothetical protein
MREHVGGEAVVVCRHGAEGQLTHCRVQGETPPGYGFGAAVLGLSAKYRLRLDGATKPPAEVVLPMFFSAPGPTPPARESAFQTSPRQYAWLAPVGPYWPERALRMNVGGRAVIDCRVQDTGHLIDCRPVLDLPIAGGFLDATLLMAKRGWMTAAPLAAGATEPSDGYWRFEVDFPAKSLCDDPSFPGSRSVCPAGVKVP